MKNKINEAVLHITTCCTHYCPFCYAIDDTVPHFHQDVSKLRKIVQRLYDVGCNSILFVGGDPASHPDVVDLSLFSINLGIETAILSNTLTFRNHDSKTVSNSFNSIETTIHRANPEAHDSFCGSKGAYSTVIQNLASFQNGVAGLGIVINLTPDTYIQVFDIIKRVIEIDRVLINHVVLQRIVPIGRAYKHTQWQLTQESIDLIFEQIEKITSYYGIQCSFEDTFPVCKLPEKYRPYIKKCEWGTNRISLDMYGNFSKCCADPRFTVGNILELDFVDVWDHSNILKDRRNGSLVPETCRRCHNFSVCGGGCVFASELNECQGDPLLLNKEVSKCAYI